MKENVMLPHEMHLSFCSASPVNYQPVPFIRAGSKYLEK
uniref:Uncharacterized protein n=1 Tax=Anguilla anguilla TaxID=7936 RepID=A0A0E9PFT0_ANGAN